MSPRSGQLWVGVGLLLVALEIRGLGLDVADDTVGFAIVALAALRLRQARWSLVAASAGVAALVSLFGYGGPVSHLVVFGDDTWVSVVAAETVTRSLCVAAVLWALRGRPARSRRTPALLAAAAAAVLAASLAWAAVFVVTAGDAGVLAQLLGVALGLLHASAIVLTLTMSEKL